MGCTMKKAVPGSLSAVALTDDTTSPMTDLIYPRTFSASMSVDDLALISLLVCGQLLHLIFTPGDLFELLLILIERKSAQSLQ